MTRGDVPEWAIDEFCRRANLVRALAFSDCSDAGIVLRSAVRAGAALIAQHEEPPVDPLLTATREVLGAWAEDTWGKGNSFAAEYRSGVLDGDSNFQLAATALRRGMELAKERQP